MTYAKIAGLGSYVPKFALKNDGLVQILRDFYPLNQGESDQEIEKKTHTSDEWILNRTGMETRYIASADETNATMAKEATLRALEDSYNWVEGGVSVKDIDYILLASNTNPNQHMFPNGASHLQDLLGANIAGGNHKDVPCLDIPAGCTSSTYALEIADEKIKTGKYKTILLVGSDKLSSVVNYADRDTCVLFSDMAGAMILQASEEPGVVNNVSYCDGSLRDKLRLKRKEEFEIDKEGREKKEHLKHAIPEEPSEFTRRFFKYMGRELEDVVPENYMHMDGKEVFKFAVNAMTKAVRDVLDGTGYTLDDVKMIDPHQANQRIISGGERKLGKSAKGKVYSNVDRFGNSSGASYMHALCEAYQRELIGKGDLIVLVAFGAGLTYGANALIL